MSELTPEELRQYIGRHIGDLAEHECLHYWPVVDPKTLLITDILDAACIDSKYKLADYVNGLLVTRECACDCLVMESTPA